ncbi:foldase protein PrsA [Paenibacillus contaminans]|uniref:peptidylprolyl isomerase n=1 Tax=Paenibacillus contaminans TaxID=450362 RepID=A0A329MQB3_9BACL|nr:peptidylprolyl isomerase [Paenibacillus contaminans]RAV21486.1 hypothetical protein DQG23_09420 [Paenibacillus contaminans]
MKAMEQVALSVNGTEWRLRDILKLAAMTGRFTTVEDGIRRAVILAVAEQHGLPADEQEWKAAANAMRQQMGLYSAAETKAWLRRHGLATTDLFEEARARLLTEKVKRLVTEARVDAYFLENRLAFDRACVSQLALRTREQALELRFQLEEGGSFYELAQTYSVIGGSRYDGGYVGWVGRAELSGEEEALVFGAEAGSTVGPFPFGSCYRLLHVWEVNSAALTGELRLQLADQLFEAWLDEAVNQANVDVKLWRDLAGEA